MFRSVNVAFRPVVKAFDNKSITSISKCAVVTGSRSFTTNTSGKIKHKPPQKRASSLFNTLRKEEFSNMKNGRQWPEFRAGDSIEIEELPYMTATETEKVRGVVIGIFNKASDTCVELANCEYGTPFIRRIIIYNPLVKNVKILQRRFIRGGERRVRRSKLYYLYERDPQVYTVSYK